MEPEKKRTRGRPLGGSVKGNQNDYESRLRANYLELERKLEVEVEGDRKRVMSVDDSTYEEWKKLRQDAGVADDNHFAMLLLKTYKEYQKLKLNSRVEPGTRLQVSQGTDTKIVPKQSTIVQTGPPERTPVPYGQPRRKRGRPPKNRPVVFSVETTRVVTLPRANQSINTSSFNTRTETNNGKTGEQSIHSPRGETNSATGGAGVPIKEVHTQELPPAVRSARLAFSLALQNSCKALSYNHSQEPSVAEYDSALLDERLSVGSHEPPQPTQNETDSLEQPEDLSQDNNQFECSDVQTSDSERYLYELNSEQVSINQVAVMNSACIFQRDVQQLQPSSTHDSSEQELSAEDPSNEQWVTVEPDLQEDNAIHETEESDIQSSKLVLDPEVKGHIGQGSLEECEPMDQASNMNPVAARRVRVPDAKVPDPMRRSRLNQITGGLLNKLKKKADNSETQDSSTNLK